MNADGHPTRYTDHNASNAPSKRRMSLQPSKKPFENYFISKKRKTEGMVQGVTSHFINATRLCHAVPIAAFHPPIVDFSHLPFCCLLHPLFLFLFFLALVLMATFSVQTTSIQKEYRQDALEVEEEENPPSST